ncbi:hypothetical protein RF11_04504 [Thelohanellus kitauei]|uniref:Uncharacterized protein n=1 Tax=Thelohanellus kitauei TaxID=669202 RepID=A0A0C2MKB5_THEKT|nr:hypothetical protein RF11_04504 [Thelohanellus kitauei]
MTLGIDMKLVISLPRRSFEFTNFHILWDQIDITKHVITVDLDNVAAKLQLRMNVDDKLIRRRLVIRHTEVELMYEAKVAFYITTDKFISTHKKSFQFNTDKEYGPLRLKPDFEPKKPTIKPEIMIFFNELSLFFEGYIDDNTKATKSNKIIHRIKYRAKVAPTTITPRKIEKSLDEGKIQPKSNVTPKSNKKKKKTKKETNMKSKGGNIF